jgi:hypothetical protein
MNRGMNKRKNEGMTRNEGNEQKNRPIESGTGKQTKERFEKYFRAESKRE